MILLELLFVGALGMAGGFLSGYFMGLAKGLNTPKEPKEVDYSKIIEVGDTVGFKFASHYLEGIVKAILEGNSIVHEEPEYVITITFDLPNDPLFSKVFTWVGYTKTLDMKYRQWTMIKKNPKRQPVSTVIQQLDRELNK
jgi:hypothetical protein